MVERLPPASLVLQCADHPRPPERIANDAELGLYIVTLAVAGEDCRQKHRGLSQWVKGEIDAHAAVVAGKKVEIIPPPGR